MGKKSSRKKGGGAYSPVATLAERLAMNYNMDMKICRTCKKEKLLSDFHKGENRCKPCVSEKGRKYRAAYPEKLGKSQRAWRINNPEKHKKSYTDSNRKRRRGWTPERFQCFNYAQGGLCQICGEPGFEGRQLDADHNHTTNEPRGLLCSPCNRAVGFLKDSPYLARKLAEYLERYS